MNIKLPLSKYIYINNILILFYSLLLLLGQILFLLIFNLFNSFKIYLFII